MLFVCGSDGFYGFCDGEVGQQFVGLKDGVDVISMCGCFWIGVQDIDFFIVGFGYVKKYVDGCGFVGFVRFEEGYDFFVVDCY